MKSEQYTEKLILDSMGIQIGQNKFGYVYPQGNMENADKLERLLKKAGGKPKECELYDYPTESKGKAKPEFIITYLKDPNTVVVIEAKKDVKKHASEYLNKPADYAVDGALYYAKFLKEKYNVYAIATSGTEDKKYRSQTFLWRKGDENYSLINKFNDSILEPENYLRHLKGEKIRKDFSLETVRKTALELHDALREIKIIERQKPIFIAGILIALEDESFADNYENYKDYKSLMYNLQKAISDKLEESSIRQDKVKNLINAFKDLNTNVKLPTIPLTDKGSIRWYIEKLDTNIKPMLNFSEITVDALGVFYHEFIKYSGGDGKGLGIVLTPEHLTDFMCDLAKINKNTRVLDICCGSAGFLVTAMAKMLKESNHNEAIRIKKENLYGVEQELELYTLAVTNMIVRRDGKSNIIHADCFSKKTSDFLKDRKINVGLMNPPYSQKDYTELEFVEKLLEFLEIGGTGVVVVPMSCAIGTKFKEVRERLFKHHTLEAVFSMPDDIFYPTGTNVCVMVWTAHKPHNSKIKTFFGYYKNDGFEKRKKLGRVDVNNTWKETKEEWLSLYFNKEVVAGLTCMKEVTHKDEWLCEAYIETDFSKLTLEDFKKTTRKYLSYLIEYGLADLCSNFDIKSYKSIDLNIVNWKKFKIEDLFIVSGTKTTPKLDIFINGHGNYPYVTTQSTNNGVEGFYNYFTEFGEVLVVDSAVVGYCSYQESNFSASDHVEKLELKNCKLNKYIALFLVTIMNQENYRYSYGRKFSQVRIKDTTIKLPVDKNGLPDWEFMENYIKSLPYSDKI